MAKINSEKNLTETNETSDINDSSLGNPILSEANSDVSTSVENNLGVNLEEGIKKEAEFLKEFEEKEMGKKEDLDSLFDGELTEERKKVVEEYLKHNFGGNVYDVGKTLKENGENKSEIYKTLLEEAKYFANTHGPNPEDYSRFVDFADSIKQNINSQNIKEGHLLRIMDSLGSEFANSIPKKCFFQEGGIGNFMRMHEIYNKEINNKWDKCYHSYKSVQSVDMRTKKSSKKAIDHILNKLDLQTHDNESIVIRDVPCGPSEFSAQILKNQKLRDEAEKKNIKIHLEHLDFDKDAVLFSQERIKQLANNSSNISVNIGQGNALRMRQDPQCDVLYCGGLLDYLNEKAGKMLLQSIYKSLKPGGKAYIGQFKQENPDRNSMEIILNWNLLFQSKEEFKNLALDAGIAEDQISFLSMDNLDSTQMLMQIEKKD